MHDHGAGEIYPRSIDRRSFLKYSAAVSAGMSAASMLGTTVARATAPWPTGPTGVLDSPWTEATIADMQAAMASGSATALSITRDHLARIEAMDWAGPRVNSIIEVNPDAEAIATALDRERSAGHVRGPLHGIPIVLKDVVATADRMETTAGSLALVGSKVPRDAGVAARLREAGAILLGKANLSEWNAFRGYPSRGGWSARAGVGRNPYALNYSTGDSSSGSAAAVAASFAAGAVGLETYGSIVMPSSLCGVVGLKPTSGLVSRSGTIPISFTRDVIGPIARTVTDVAMLLSGMVGADPLDPLTGSSEGHTPTDYLRFLDKDGLRGARIGVWRRPDLWKDDKLAKRFEHLLPVFRDLGATLVDAVELPNWASATGEHVNVMFTENRFGIKRYLSELTNTDMLTLGDVIAFNEAHPDEELQWHPQNLLEGAFEEDWTLTGHDYLRSLRLSRELGQGAFEHAMRRHRLDAIIAPTFVRAWPIDLVEGDPPVGNGAAGPSNAAGYPHLTVPAVFIGKLPIGISFLGRAWEEPKLLRFGYAFEQAVQARRPPEYLDAGADFVER
jgi:amidase